MTVNFKDNSGAVLSAFHSAVEKALEECGLVAEGYAKKLVNSPGKTGTGRLRNSISHRVDPEEPAVYIGTDVKYAAYQEFGTGIYTEGGRDTPWVYQDEKGNWHWTRGNKAQPFLKPAVADHARQYRQIIEQELKKG